MASQVGHILPLDISERNKCSLRTGKEISLLELHTKYFFEEKKVRNKGPDPASAALNSLSFAIDAILVFQTLGNHKVSNLLAMEVKQRP